MKYNYSQIWRRIEKLPWVALVTTGRNGSDYFQSLLDGHPEVFVFNGEILFHNDFWKKSRCVNYQGQIDISDLVDEFIGKYISRFKSKYDYIEGKDRLGDHKQEHVDIDLLQFRKHCVSLAKLKSIGSKHFLQSVYTAYALCLKQDFEKKKLFFHHIHNIWCLDDFLKDFPHTKIISMTRDPRASYVSGVEHWRRFDLLEDTPQRVFFTLNRVVKDAQSLKKYPNDFMVLRLETLEDVTILKKVCKWLDISFDPCLKSSTWAGLKWWGDRLSVQPKYKDHEQFSKAIRRNKWEQKLSKVDRLIFEYLLADRLKLFKYEFKEKKGLWYGILMWFLIFLPTTYERRHLSLRFQLRWLKSKKLKNMLLAFYFYFKRIILFNKLFFNKHSSDPFNLPYFS